MFSQQLVTSYTQIVRASVARLRDLANLTLEQFKSNPDNYAIAEHHLRRALQSLLDLGRHIVVKSGWGNPANYREVFDLLEKGGVVDKNFRLRVQGMAGYRNRLVHEYAEVTQDEMWWILQNQLDDLLALLDRFLVYITHHA